MKKSKIEIKCKSRFGQEKTVKADYEEPESFEEALKMDSKEEIYKVYRIKRKSNFMDDIRRKEVIRMEKPFSEALNDPDKLAQITAILNS